MAISPETEDLKRQTLAALKARQMSWLVESGIERERPDYTLKTEGNLFAPLSSECISDLSRAQGGELKRRNSGASPPKFHAVHSSSVLVANVFDYWRHRDLSIVSKALNAPVPIARMEIEVPFSTGYGFPCNLDVVLASESDEFILGIESKFTEPFGKTKAGLKIGYVPPDGDSAWKKRGLDKCDRLAREIQGDPTQFDYLDVPQLLKHILGLHRKMNDRFRLVYLYYDVATAAGVAHRDEVEKFSQAVSGEVDFESTTYQTLVDRLKALSGPTDVSYFDYLKHRYQLG